MPRTCIVLLCLVLYVAFLPVKAIAAPPDAEAQQRAAEYQKAALAELSREHWRIVANQPGRLVVQHRIDLPYPAGEYGGYQQLNVTFLPKSSTDTECVIDLVDFLYGRSSSGDIKKSYGKPVHVNSPESTEEVHRLLRLARRRMAAAHPEYFASPVR